MWPHGSMAPQGWAQPPSPASSSQSEAVRTRVTLPCRSQRSWSKEKGGGTGEVGAGCVTACTVAGALLSSGERLRAQLSHHPQCFQPEPLFLPTCLFPAREIQQLTLVPCLPPFF